MGFPGTVLYIRLWPVLSVLVSCGILLPCLVERTQDCLGWVIWLGLSNTENLLFWMPGAMRSLLYTHSPVASTFFCCTVSAYTSHILMRVTHAWLKCREKGVCTCVFDLSISPSPFSCCTRLCCSCTVTSRPVPTTTPLTPTSTSSCRTFPSYKRRTCITKFCYLAKSEAKHRL